MATLPFLGRSWTSRPVSSVLRRNTVAAWLADVRQEPPGGVRFLIDEMLPPDAAAPLRAEHGPDVVHVRQVGLQGADDRTVADHAGRDDRLARWASENPRPYVGQHGPAEPAALPDGPTNGARDTHPSAHRTSRDVRRARTDLGGLGNAVRPAPVGG